MIGSAPFTNAAIKKGKGKGLEKGREEGRLSIIRRQTEKRFGPLPDWANTRLTQLTTPELEELSLRLLDVQTLDELFAR